MQPANDQAQGLYRLCYRLTNVIYGHLYKFKGSGRRDTPALGSPEYVPTSEITCYWYQRSVVIFYNTQLSKLHHGYQYPQVQLFRLL